MDDFAMTVPGLSVVPSHAPARPSSAGEDAARGERPDVDATLEAARQFEALLVQQMLRSMRAAGAVMAGSNAQDLYQDQYDGEIAKLVSGAGGLGLADALARQLGVPDSSNNAPEPDMTRRDDRDTGRVAQGSTSATTADHLRLRELYANGQTVDALKQWQGSADLSAPTQSGRHSNAGSERAWATSLWSAVPPSARDGMDPHAVKRTFIDSLKPLIGASARRLGTSALPILAVAAHETGWGRHLPADAERSSHNLFGIKASADDPNAVRQRTTEYVHGQRVHETARFRHFAGPAQSVAGFADFLEQNPRYRTALAHASNPERFIRELQRAGYATDPAYADKVIRVMQELRTLDPDLEGAETS